MKYVIITCKRCGCSLRVPLNKGVLEVTCPKCKYKFRYDSGPRQVNMEGTANVAKTVKTSQNSNSEHKTAQAASRTVTIRRLTHAYKEWNASGLGNMLKDSVPVHIFADDQDQGTLPKDGSLTINLNSGPHALKCYALGKKYMIPAGTDDYEAYCFNNALKIGPVNDYFRDSLTMFVLNIFRGQGIRDRMVDPNNQYHNVVINIGQDGIRLSWRLAQTHGLKQWATGSDEVKISYQEVGIMPLPPDKQPGGYWDYIKMRIEDAVEFDKQADMERYMGGFRVRTKHNLY